MIAPNGIVLTMLKIVCPLKRFWIINPTAIRPHPDLEDKDKNIYQHDP